MHDTSPRQLSRAPHPSAPPYYSAGEAIAGSFQAVGIRTRLRNVERAAFLSAWSAKTLKGVCMCAVGTHGNAATRLSQFLPSDGLNAYGGWPDLDAQFAQQSRELDKKKREALLHRIQQTAFERVRFAGLWDYVWPSCVGPRVAEPAFLLIDPYPWSAQYEDLRLKK